MQLVKTLINEHITRVVEGQSYISTRQLVDSDGEQALLEQLLDGNKPPYPGHQGVDALHYLLKTPFRYPPLRHGSRFGRTDEHGIFYGSLHVGTALCEMAYVRFKFLADSEAKLRPSLIPHTSFAVLVDTHAGLNLTTEQWQEHIARICSPVTYQFSQELGSQARQNGVEAIQYYSARAANGQNMAVLAPNIFIGKRIKQLQHWNAYVDYSTITFTKDGTREAFTFPKTHYAVNGAFPYIG